MKKSVKNNNSNTTINKTTYSYSTEYGKNHAKNNTTIIVNRNSDRFVGKINSIFCLFSFILLIIALFYTLRGNKDIFTFKALIEYLSNAPNVKLILRFDLLSIPGPWAILDGLRVFINYLTAPLSFFVSIVLLLMEVIFFVFYLFGIFAL